MGQNKAKKAAIPPGTVGQRHRLRKFGVGLMLAAAALLLVFAGVRFLSARRAIRELPTLPKISDANPRLKEALAEADRDSRARPLEGDSVGSLGRIYHANFFYEQAKFCYRLAARRQPRNPRWPYYLADIGEKMGETRDTVEMLETTVRLEPGYDPARLRLANAYFKADRIADAETEFRVLLDHAEASPYALAGLGRIAISRRDWTKAAEFLEKSVERIPRYGVALRLLATAYERLERPEPATIARDRASFELFCELPDPWIEELDPDCHDVAGLVRLATDALKYQRRERAFKLCEQALSVVPGNAENTMAVAMALYNSQSHSMSMPFFQKVTQLEPANKEAYFRMAAMNVESGNFDEAEKNFRRILEIDPRSTLAWVGLGDIRFRRREIGPAAGFYRKARELEPRSPRVLYALGTVEYEKKNLKTAIQFLEEALRLDERSIDAHLTLGTIMAERDELDRAAAHFRRIIEINPFLAMGRYNLGNVHYRRGQFADAIYQYGRALDLDPGFADARLNLGAALEKSGKRAEALAQFHAALDLARKTGDSDLESKILDNLKTVGQ